MNIVKRLSYVFWWIAILLLLGMAEDLVIVVGAIFVLATPFYSWIVPSNQNVQPIPLNSLHKFSALSTMTALGLFKAGIENGFITPKKPSKLLKLSKSKPNL